jgi:hypothetical protein
MKQKQGLCASRVLGAGCLCIHRAAEKMPSGNLLRLLALRPID